MRKSVDSLKVEVKRSKFDIDEMIKRLEVEHPNAVCELNHSSVFELLVAVTLSAQCTDKRVNMVTEKLFKVYNTPEQFANMDIDELISYIRPCGFFNNKAKAIIESSRSIVNDFNGQVPDNIPDLMKLKGVGRKTANVVYSVGFGGDAFAVDTHVFRVSNRIGLVHERNVENTEEALMELVPQEKWVKLHHLLIHHGRYTCKARVPMCNECLIADMCEHLKR